MYCQLAIILMFMFCSTEGQGCGCHQYVIENENKDGVCLKGWSKFGESCYHFEHSADRFSKAMLQCHANGGHLAEVTNAVENNYIVNMSGLMQVNLWLGGSDLVVQGEWLWVDSWTLISNTSYNNWANGKPQRGASCLAIVYGTGQWHNRACDLRSGFVCEMTLENSATMDSFCGAC